MAGSLLGALGLKNSVVFRSLRWFLGVFTVVFRCFKEKTGGLYGISEVLWLFSGVLWCFMRAFRCSTVVNLVVFRCTCCLHMIFGLTILGILEGMMV